MRRAFLLPLLAIALTAAACGADEHHATDLAGPPSHTREHRPPAATAAPSAPSTPHAAAPSEPPEPPEPPAAKARRAARQVSGKAVPPASARPGPFDAHLLTAEDLPGLGDDLTWDVVTDGPEGSDRVGACQKTSLVSIGAVSAVRREFSATDGATTATQVVARFADARSAWRAHEVLRAWRDDCEERLDYPRARVGDLETVAVSAGSADSYRAAYGPMPAARGWTAGLGIVRHDSWLSVVEVTTTPEDYPDRRDPARVAARRIARTFA